MRVFRLFLSSPGDAAIERRRTESVVSRLNGEFVGLARIDAVRWETEHYKAHATFQTQIPPAAECDIVVGILKWRLGTELPPDFADHLPSGESYPSGTAYEILTAIEKRRRGGELPDVFVFRYTGGAPQIVIGEPDEERKRHDWATLRLFFEQWFVSEKGHFLAALNSYVSEDDFESQLERLLRKWLAEKVAGGRVTAWPATKGSPFPGLSVFGARHAPVFFGRAGDVRRAMDSLRDCAARGAPFLLLVGASGAGKSSLARAGLIPRLTTPGVAPEVDLGRVAAMRPGDSPDGPFASLAAALLQAEADLPAQEEGRGPALPEIAAGDSKTPAELALVLAHADAVAVRPIINALSRISESARASGRYGRKVRCDLVLLVDQLDELFSPSLSPEIRRRFADLLAALASTRRVWLIATLRADLYGPMLEVPALKTLKDEGASYDLAPPGPAELIEIVREPAKAAGLTFATDPATGERLDERLLREADRPDMLPLVQLALSRLWEAREINGDDVVLPCSAFEKLGGVKGIIEEAGETALAKLTQAQRARLPPLIRSLAELSPGRAGAAAALTARAVPIAEAAPDGESEALVDAIVGARLLTRSGKGGATSVRLAHQRVLSDWARAAAIVADSADFYRVRDEVEDQRRRWEIGKRRGELLLARGLPLAEARTMAAKYGAELSPEIRAFIDASRRRANRAQMLGWAAAAVFALVAIAAGLSAKVAVDQRAVATNALAQAAANYQVAVDQAAGASELLADAYEDGSISTVLMKPLMAQALDTVNRLGGDSDEVASARIRLLDDLALASVTFGDIASARKFTDEENALADRLLAKAPTDVAWRRLWAVGRGRLSDALYYAGDVPGALAKGREAADAALQIVTANPGDEEMQRSLFFDFQRVADPLRAEGDLEGANREYRLWLDHANALHARDPKNPQWLRALAFGYERFGDLLIAQDKAQDAETQYKSFNSFASQALAAQPQNAIFQDALALSHQRLGDSELALARFPEALAEYTQYEVQAAQLSNRVDPLNFRWREMLEIAHQRIGDVSMAQKEFAAALDEYGAYASMTAEALAKDASQTRALYDAANAHEKVGDALRELGRLDEAASQYQEDASIMAKLMVNAPSNVEWQKGLAAAHQRLALVLQQQKNPLARDEFQKCAAATVAPNSFTPRTTWPKDVNQYCRDQLDQLDRAAPK